MNNQDLIKRLLALVAGRYSDLSPEIHATLRSLEERGLISITGQGNQMEVAFLGPNDSTKTQPEETK